MKKIFTLILSVSILVSACKKNKEGVPVENSIKKYNVTFDPELFEQSSGIFKSATAPQISDDPMPKLYSRIYNLDASGTLVSKESGALLVPGNYVAVFVASNHTFNRLYGLGGQLEETRFNAAYFDTRLSVAVMTWPLNNDIFYKKVFFTVTNKDIGQKVILERIVAGLEIIIEDEIPPAVTAIEATIVDDAPYFHFIDDSRRKGGTDKIATFGRGSKVLNTFVLGSGSEIIIRAYDSANKVVKDKRIRCSFYPNKRTTLSGKLFTDLVVFGITVNSLWDTPPATIPF